MIKFNINHRARVKLTPEGRATHLADHAIFWARHNVKNPPAYVPPAEDAEGYSIWQLWVLMRSFGPYMLNGGPLMFETEIQLLPDGNAGAAGKAEEHHCG